MQVNGIENQTDSKREIVNIFYWLESWQPDQSDSSKRNLQNEWHLIENLQQIRNYN